MFFAILTFDPPPVIPYPIVSERGRFGLGVAFQRRTTPFDAGVLVVCRLSIVGVGSQSPQEGSGPGAEVDVAACVLDGTVNSSVSLPKPS